MYFPLFVGGLCLYLFMHYFVSILVKSGCIAILSYNCIATVNVLWFFLTVPWVDLQCVIVVFLDHTNLFFI